jgi:putative SbcD/Mre11-related phosphoesterase
LPLDASRSDGWWLTAALGLIHRGKRTAVIADVHLGYEWARGATGDVIPTHTLSEMFTRLEAILALTPIERLIVAGDLVESHRCRQTRTDVEKLRRRLASQGVRLDLIGGNHDGENLGAPWTEVGDWTIGHGHHAFPGRCRIIGHLHPVLKLAGVTAPCFVVRASTIILPAFSSNAAGIDARRLAPPGWLPTEPARYVAALDGELFDFGALQSSRSPAAGSRSLRR